MITALRMLHIGIMVLASSRTQWTSRVLVECPAQLTIDKSAVPPDTSPCSGARQQLAHRQFCDEPRRGTAL